jgi:hypothetical protein
MSDSSSRTLTSVSFNILYYKTKANMLQLSNAVVGSPLAYHDTLTIRSLHLIEALPALHLRRYTYI